MNEGCPPSPRRSYPGLDAYRGLVVILMIAVHVRRLELRGVGWETGASLIDPVFRFLFLIEPWIAASFLFIAGFSLELSRERAAPSEWRRRILLRAGQLYAIGVLLFIPHLGVQLPDLLVSPGILSVIAVGLVGVAVTPPTQLGSAGLAIGLVGLLLVNRWLDAQGASIPGLDAGMGGQLPMVGFVALGALARRWSAIEGWRRALGTTVLTTVAAALAWFAGETWIIHKSVVMLRYRSEVAVLGWLKGETGVPRSEQFWNPTSSGWLGLVLPLVLAMLATGALDQRWGQSAPVRLLKRLGRHALGIYVAHLLALGGLDLLGWGPRGPLLTLGYWLGLCTLLLLATATRERFRAVSR